MSAFVDICMPEEQSEGTTSTVSAWLVQPGGRVTEHQPVVEIETDKVTVEVAAPVSGVLSDIVRQPGDEAGPGEVLGRINVGVAAGEPVGGRSDDADAAAQPPAGSGARRPASPARSSAGGAQHRLSPAVRRLLKQYGLDANELTGSGRDGRITTGDVIAASAAASAAVPVQAGGQASARAAPPPGAPPAPAAGAIRGRLVPHDAMRRRIAKHMVASLLETAPHVTSVFEADLSRVMAHRERHRAEFEARQVKLTLTAYFVRAACVALERVPEVNGRYHDDALEIFDDCNIGVGTALGDKGLIVPVLKRAQTLDLFATAERLQDQTLRARDGTLSPEEVRDGTFTISNHGVGGSLIAAPIVINQPQVAILGLGKVGKRVVVAAENGRDTMVIRPMCYVTLTIDHRALDAFQTNAFLACFVETLESWPAD